MRDAGSQNAVEFALRVTLHLPRTKTPFLLPVLGVALLFALAAAIPYVLHALSPSFEGLTVIRDKDYGNYYSRLERSLSGYPEEADNGITEIGSGIDGAQTAGLEVALGMFLGWTRADSPTLPVVLTPLFVFTLFLLFFFLFRVLKFSPSASLGMASLYFFILFHVVSRVMHPGWSFVPTVAALLSFFHFWKRPSVSLAVLTGVLLGVLPYLYFWSFTYVWAVAGCAVVLSFFTLRVHSTPSTPSHLHTAVLVLTALFVSHPFFIHLLNLWSHLLYDAVAFRGGFLTETVIESYPRSILLTVQVLLLLSLFRERKKEWSYIATLSLLLGIFLAMHQNLLHGTLLMFSSHYYPHLVLSTLVAGGYVLTHSVPVLHRTVIGGISLLFLAGAAYDYLPGYKFFLPTESHFSDQHLKRPIEMLRDNETEDIVVTDAHTGRVLTSFLPEGIVYTSHTRFLLISDEEMAERYCVSNVFSVQSPDPYRTLYIEYRAELDAPEARKRENDLVNAACARVRADPLSYLRKYHVTHILWNQHISDEWNILQYKLPLKALESSSDWILLELLPEPA